MKSFLKAVLKDTPVETCVQYCRAVCNGKGARMGFHYDKQTSAIMKRILSNGDGCIDVGCHQGEILKAMLKLSPEGMHLAFEPLPNMFKGLKKDFSHMSNVHLFEVALGDSEGAVVFNHVVTNPAYSGFLKRKLDRPDEIVEEINVSVKRLDSLAPLGYTPRLIKIDVEGAELQVLRGAVQMIRQAQPYIIFEHGLGASDVYGTRPDDIWKLLHDECGLQLTLMHRWLHGKPPLNRDEFNQQFYERLNFYFLAYPATIKN